MMKSLGLMLLSLAFSLQLLAAPAKPGKALYPRICGIEGSPEIIQSGKALGTNPKDKLDEKVLKEKVLFKTDAGSKVCVEMEEGLKVNVFGDSEVFIPAIDWETGRVEELELNAGKMLVKNAAPAKGLRLESPLYREDLPTGQYVFEYNPQSANLRVTVLEGELPFRGLETEVYSKLGPGETQTFLGEIKEGLVQYDVLLAGKKVARGQLGAKTKMADADLKTLASYFAIKAPPKKKVRPKTAEELAAASGKSRPSGKVCAKPTGGFNDCLFRCQNNPKGKKECELSNPKVSCVRLRCLANGEWGDVFEFAKSKSPCEAIDIVKACDY